MALFDLAEMDRLPKWDVVYQGIFCLTVSAASVEEAFQMAMHALGVDSDDDVEVWEVD
ncbi:hypothetical protein M8R19_33040 [Pseudomonas sp. R3.Fl]|uniref:hypothetical protein n=1 Tax=Pseudomonas sp. R3.Fl TaxID=2928708 RepID=UPI00201D6468|nr:hypothetical protein [Pseudomonas sp. R3.Fl]MCL6687100.1 hypothetical protein [Pseudomonas sp. R3.Fl]MCL6687111.1 hypothetical protein [Pseudomonas sp. R3.Fl]MCL6687122.1 hypothetical protein [Pseudomonas sp. R3.Fl]MCL6693496.1 hypothetical protein [Pseudomonas sp. R3.Fl]MCL6693507.1 hypothetical protein [Pseudomonas sp. R3.Fl]